MAHEVECHVCLDELGEEAPLHPAEELPGGFSRALERFHDGRVLCFSWGLLSAFSCVGLPAAADRFASGLLFRLGIVCVHLIL